MATGDKESTEVIKRFQDLKEKKTRVQDSEKLNAIFDLLHEYLPSIVATSSTLTALNEEITEFSLQIQHLVFIFWMIAIPTNP